MAAQPLIPDSFKQDLLNRVDVVDLVGRSVQLRKAGTNFLGLCPFHGEKTPSFTVSQSKQFYHCFGCGAHGNAISFLMEYQGMGYIDALRELAEGVGMKLPELERGRDRKPDDGPDLYAVLTRAMNWYREQLKLTPRAVDYLKRRGLTGKVAAHFGIGYAPDGWQGLKAVFPEGTMAEGGPEGLVDYGSKALKDVGLVIDADGGRRYDRFRDRIMFPILNQRGMVIGFGGRVIDAGEPKYLNSPETTLFEKGRELYGLSQARGPIREAGRAIVVEGYMDVVALAQSGVGYAVATLGTATSAHHLQKLFRQTDEVVFCFDGDAAGRKAAWHALEVSLPVLADNKLVRFLFLPPEHDPDSYVRELGREAFESALAAARPLSTVMLDELRSGVDMTTPEGRSRMIHEAKALVGKVAAPALQLQLVRSLAEAASMPAEEVGRLTGVRVAAPRQSWGQDGRGGGRGGYGSGALPAPSPRPSPARSMERELLKCVLVNEGLAGRVPREGVLGEGEDARALLVVADWLGEHASPQGEDAEPGTSLAALMEAFRDTEHQDILSRASAEMMAERSDAETAEAVFGDVLKRLELESLDRQIEGLLRQGLGDPEAGARLQALDARRRALRMAGPATDKVL